MNRPEPELFVTKGILPENLPPIFTTAGIWGAFSAYGTSYAVTSKCEGRHAHFNASGLIPTFGTLGFGRR